MILVAHRGRWPMISCAVLILLTLRPIDAVSAPSPVKAPSQPAAQGFLNHNVFVQGLLKLTGSDLRSLVGGDDNMTVQGFLWLIQTLFWTSQTRVVGLDVGWTTMANATSPIGREAWIDDFLTAADAGGIYVAFHLPDWGSTPAGNSWWGDVELRYPFLRTVGPGSSPITTSVPFSLVLNAPTVVAQLERDLSQMLLYYGRHPSWVGLVSDSLIDNPSSDKFLSASGFDRYTISDFSHSSFYLKTVNALGYYPDGSKSGLWTAFHQPLLTPSLESGSWQSTDSALLLNGSKSAVGLRFSLLRATSSASVRFYMGKMGMPRSDLSVSLHPASNGSGLPGLNQIMANATLAEGDVPSAPGWTKEIQLDVPLLANTTYWVLLEAPSGDKDNAYRVFYRTFNVDDSAFATQTSSGQWSVAGSAIAWFTGMEGDDLRIYPFQNVGISRNDRTPVDQEFQTRAALDVRTVFLHLADKYHSSLNSTLEIADNVDNSIVTSVSFSQSEFKGTYWWAPISLRNPVHLDANHSYSIRLVGAPAGNGWQWHYLYTDPPKSGFEGKQKVQLFRLESYEISSLNLMHIGPPGRLGPENGFPGATNTTFYAQRYNFSTSAVLSEVRANVEKYCQPGSVTGVLLPCSGGEHPGNLVIQVRLDDGTGKAPGRLVLAQKVVNEGEIPWGRVWVNASGWSLIVGRGLLYWVVLSTADGTAGGYYPWKEESAYQHPIARSNDGGLTWVQPREPADALIEVKTTAQSMTTEPEIEVTVRVSNSNWVAQSFEVPRVTNLTTVLVFVSRFSSDQYRTITADVQTDDGFGHPSGMVLATGTTDLGQSPMTWKGLWSVNLDFPMTLTPGVRYWLVFRSVQGSGMAVQTFGFAHDSDSYGGSDLEMLLSTDAGGSWGTPSGRQFDLIFGLANSESAQPKPSLSELAAEVQSRQATIGIGGEGAEGWRAYLASSTTRIQTALLKWLNSQNINSTERTSTVESTPARDRWVSLDQNPPSLFMTVSPTASQLDLYPRITLGQGTPATAPGIAIESSIPLIVLRANSSTATTQLQSYISIIPSLNRSIVFLDADPVSFLADAKAFGSFFGLFGRMRSSSLSWPEMSQSRSMTSVGPWLLSFGNSTYDLPGGTDDEPRGIAWATLDVLEMSLTWTDRGARQSTGPEIDGSLTASYLIRTLGNLGVLYSNAEVTNHTIYPNQALTEVAALPGQAEWVLVNSTLEIESVLVGGQALEKAPSYEWRVRAEYSAKGWYWDAQSRTLLIRFPSSGYDIVRTIEVSQDVSQRFGDLAFKVAPFVVISVALLVDLILWLGAARGNARRRAEKTVGGT